MLQRPMLRRSRACVRASTTLAATAILLCLVVEVPAAWADSAAAVVWSSRCSGIRWTLTPKSDEIVVSYREAASAASRAALAAAAALTEIETFHPLLAAASYQVPAGSPVTEVLRRLRESPHVRAALPAFVDQNGDIKRHVPGQLYLQFRASLPESECRARVARAGAVMRREFRHPGLYRIQDPMPGGLSATIRRWYADTDVVVVEPVYLSRWEPASNDPLFADQWQLQNTGQQSGTAGADVKAPAAWVQNRGDPDVLITIIDTGVDYEHEDLAANLLPQGNEDWHFGSDEETSADDEFGHGTGCAGMAAAIQDNALGLSGVAPACRIMPLRLGSWPTTELGDNADAIYYAASRRDEFDGLVISCSWIVTEGFTDLVFQAIFNAHDQDCVVVFAAGNQNDTVRFPASLPMTIAVGASDRCDERVQPGHCGLDPTGCSFVTWGSNAGPELDVVAPGLCTPSTQLMGMGDPDLAPNYQWFGGTSAATPLAAGVCALIWSVKPWLTNDEVRNILRWSADDQVGDPAEDTPGFDHFMGWGRVNAYAAVELARGWSDISDAPMDDEGNGQAIAWGDFDADGDSDCYVANSDGPNRLFRNDGNGAFVDVTPAGLGDPAASVAAAWGDMENDGDLDLYVVNQGAADKLFQNLGNGAFAVVSDPILGDVGQGAAVAWADFDRDGWLDFFLAKNAEPDRLFHNNGDGTFSDWSSAGVDDAGAATSAAWVDVDQDGDPDLYVVRANQPNILYENVAGGFVDISASPLNDSGDGTHAAWADFDADGDFDVYLSNQFTANKLLRNDGGAAFTDVTAGPLGDPGATQAAAWGDFENDGDLDLYLADRAAGNKLLRNDGASGFVDVTAGALLGDARLSAAAAWADIDDDGDLDLYVANHRAPNRLIRNYRREFLPPPDMGWPGMNHLSLTLEGTASNRAALGARVRVAGPSGDRHGSVAVEPYRLHFGLEAATQVDTVEILWPSGTMQILTHVPANLHLHVVEGQPTNTSSDFVANRLTVGPAWPNPFARQATLRYASPRAGRLRAAVYSADGRIVRTLFDGPQGRGVHELHWDGRTDRGARVGAGVYFVRVEGLGERATTKLVLAP